MGRRPLAAGCPFGADLPHSWTFLEVRFCKGRDRLLGTRTLGINRREVKNLGVSHQVPETPRVPGDYLSQLSPGAIWGAKRLADM